MKFKSNRFAMLPKYCHDCQRYIFLEPYRRGEKWHKFADRFIKVNICNECYDKYMFSGNFCKEKE